jgi:hypothetical protein
MFLASNTQLALVISVLFVFTEDVLSIHRGTSSLARQWLPHSLPGLRGLPLFGSVMLQRSACTPPSPPHLPWTCQYSWRGRPPAEITFLRRLQTPSLRIVDILWGSSGGSLVATPDCKPAVPGSIPAISPAYSGLPILGWAAIWNGTPL